MFYCVVKKIQVDFEKNTSLHSSIPETLEENTASYTKYADCLYLKLFAFPSMIWHIFFGILLLICWTNWKGKHMTHTIIWGLISLTCTVGKLEATQLFTLLHHLKPPISDAAGWWPMDEVCLFLVLYFDMSLLCIFVTGSGFFSCFLILFLQHWSFTDWNWSHSLRCSQQRLFPNAVWWQVPPCASPLKGNWWSCSVPKTTPGNSFLPKIFPGHACTSKGCGLTTSHQCCSEALFLALRP